jgi:heme iron utilization protein
MISFEKTLEIYRTFPNQFRSIVLSTVGPDGTPNASYAPFIIDSNRNLYIYVSGLSEHTANLRHKPIASVLLIEDESQSEQIFARRRLTYTCRANVLDRDHPLWASISEQFEARFGEIIPVLKGLPDFQIVQLVPTAGRFVVGFGAAYEVDPYDIAQLMQLQGR